MKIQIDGRLQARMLPTFGYPARNGGLPSQSGSNSRLGVSQRIPAKKKEQARETSRQRPNEGEIKGRNVRLGRSVVVALVFG
ncbi:hypothetical protein [Bradyrhizobium sp. CCBAU 65884]|uniref:hypothetical protein n=1 Tax=Bradyrhizobium sp. CCBAU 65884 TaxID=722477 RepID=UPI0023060CC8|nr:hypothetical protein [Bradyrhizobium sp. CCBAU 65884]